MTSRSDENERGDIAAEEGDECLDTAQLDRLERSFREWMDASRRADVRHSRQRILLIFLLIRYTGAKLGEVLALDPFADIDWTGPAVIFRGGSAGASPESASDSREVQISETLSREIRDRIDDPSFGENGSGPLNLDPGFVRRKFYERARACGFPKRLGGPETIRRARAVELMRNNVPLPAVRTILGHGSSDRTSAYLSLSKEEVRRIARRFMEKESARKTSARNSFFGIVRKIRRGDIQTRVDMETLDGHAVAAVITNDSLERLDLGPGAPIVAEVKAPWVVLLDGEADPVCSAENRFRGVLTKIVQGEINAEYIVRISETTELCAIVSSAGVRRLRWKRGDRVWAVFNGFSVVLHAD
jgi:molybdate transport system regulatory protein